MSDPRVMCRSLFEQGCLTMRYSAGVSESSQARKERSRVGLCFDCQYTQPIESARGSTFYRCARSDTDPNFPKYPRLPVLQCPGYARKPED